MERNNWQQERHRLMAHIDSLSCQIKQRMQISAEQQNTIEHYKRMEIQWGLEKTSLEQAEASVRARLAQTEADLGAGKRRLPDEHVFRVGGSVWLCTKDTADKRDRGRRGRHRGWAWKES